MSSELFDSERLKSIDYLILNNKIESPVDNLFTYSYQNKTTSDVQIALFYGSEIINEYDYLKKVPYFTAILKGGKKYDLPINKEEIYLYTFDKNGKRIDKKIVTSINKDVYEK